ncbi:MAG: alpha/beta hydrolase [Prolixibacteraceae bacterium]|nr:alpha/beta hydrolase [Prolixibacteraceae bacterium]
MAKKSIYKSEEGKKAILTFYEKLLTEWCRPSKQYTFNTSYGNTFIIESGDRNAPAVFLLHGSVSNSAMWISDAKTLSEKYRVFAIDIIGECGKSAQTRPEFKDGNYANWLLEIVESLGLNRVSIIACSLGGWVALDFATKHPNRVDHLVLMATAGITPIKPKAVLLIIFTSLAGKWGMQKLDKLVYGALEIDERALEFAALIKEHYNPRTEVFPVFSDEQLKQIEAPVLFIGGEHDCFYNSQKTAERIENNLGNVRCVVLENTGHVLINQTERFLQFLKE